jgi:hypothetical protein
MKIEEGISLTTKNKDLVLAMKVDDEAYSVENITNFNRYLNLKSFEKIVWSTNQEKNYLRKLMLMVI